MLRTTVIRVAYQNPHLRAHLLPLLKEAVGEVEKTPSPLLLSKALAKWVKGSPDSRFDDTRVEYDKASKVITVVAAVVGLWDADFNDLQFLERKRKTEWLKQKKAGAALLVSVLKKSLKPEVAVAYDFTPSDPMDTEYNFVSVRIEARAQVLRQQEEAAVKEQERVTREQEMAEAKAEVKSLGGLVWDPTAGYASVGWNGSKYFDQVAKYVEKSGTLAGFKIKTKVVSSGGSARLEAVVSRGGKTGTLTLSLISENSTPGYSGGTWRYSLHGQVVDGLGKSWSQHNLGTGHLGEIGHIYWQVVEGKGR